MAEYIEYDVALQFVYDACIECMESCEEFDGIYPDCHQCPLEGVKLKLRHTPAAEVRPVVLCGACELHGHCYTEDVFAFARLAEENRFCAVGKVKTNGVKREES